MIAIDTNLIVRFLVKDDPVQFERAVRVLGSHDIFIPDTVLLETEWVLRFAYSLEREVILRGFFSLLGMENVHVRDAMAVRQALDWFGDKMDFADAWHLALGQHCERFATFDEKLVKRAKGKGRVKVFRA